MERLPTDTSEYLRMYAGELGERILRQFPPLYQPGDAVLPGLDELRRKPYAAQILAIHGLVSRWDRARAAALIAECGTGKTLVSLASMHLHARGRRYVGIMMVPPQLVEKTSREIHLTLPRVRVFVIDGLRNGVGSNGYSGVNEVRLRNGRIVREGTHTTLTDMRLRKDARSARARWDALVGASSILVGSRERMKLSYFWRHAHQTPRSGPFNGCVVNPDTGRPVLTATDQLRRSDFKKAKHSEFVCPDDQSPTSKARRPFYSPLWQADGTRVHRYAPIDFIGRYMDKGFFDYAIADEVHELKSGETAQGNALGALAHCADRIAVLTGTLLGGYAEELFHILFRLDPRKMIEEGFEIGESGLRTFSESYGVLEKVTTIEAADNACSEARVTKRVRRKPGASPLLFGRFLMEMGAFVSLEDISDALPPYQEEVIAVEMDPPLRSAYEKLEKDIKAALEEHRGNQSVLSVGMNALLSYVDRPYKIGDLVGYEYVKESGRREPFLISSPAELDEAFVYAKERRMIEEVQNELRAGRKVQLYAVYTQKRDVTQRWKQLLQNEGIHAEVLTSDVPPEQREAWYERQLRQGMQVCISNPKLVMTGMDLMFANTLIFGQTGYSIFVLRQASRRSWRIGQRKPVTVKFLAYSGTMQESCLRLMGKKLLVSLAMEGKFSSEGLLSLEGDDDILTAMARELVTQKGVGEMAAAVWRELQNQHPSVAAAAIPAPPLNERTDEYEPETGASRIVVPTVEPQQARATVSLADFAAPARRPTRRPAPEDDSQLSLF
ncbi:MAG: DEAD/DEAH box helicase [Bryobacterales bacterium]|nr:DEAD/DEAH box helicase [Bryobacterales bacterium]